MSAGDRRAARLAGVLARVARLPDPLVRPSAHDLAFRRWVLQAPRSVRLLNVGAGERAPLALPNVVNLDLVPGRLVHVVGDAHALPFRGGAFDGVVCRAVLEHLHQPFQACDELWRVLREGGFVLATAPFVYPYHAHPDDYQRFTASGLRALFARFDELECGIGRLPTAAVLSTLAAYAATFADNRVVSALLRGSVAWLLNPLKYLDHYLKRKRRVHLLSSYYFLGRKPAGAGARRAKPRAAQEAHR